MRAFRQFLKRFTKEEYGQDLLEYALLGAFVAILTMAGLRVIENVMGTRYGQWDLDEQNLWRPPNPSGS
jgi:Flp pilus assembly pilin Flp